MVGTINKSMAAMCGAWLRRKVCHPWLGGPRRLTMYLATLDWATSNPSLSSSPWMRGAPQSGFSMLIRRINRRRSVSICGRPQGARLPPPVGAKAGPMPTHEHLGTDDRDDLKDRGKPSIQLDKKPAIVVRKPDPPAHLTPHNDQLMSECRVLCFKPALRLEWRGQGGKDEAEQCKHVH
jgi:hypothetical protein